MELFLGAALIAFLITKVVTTNRVEHEYAKRGEVPPRVQMKLDRIAAGSGERAPARPGARGYLRELWHDAWDDATARHKRARAEKQAGMRPTVRQRVGGWWRWATTPVGEPIETPAVVPSPVAQSPVAPPVTDVPAGTWTLDKDGQRVPLAPALPTIEAQPAASAEPTPSADRTADPLNLKLRIDSDDTSDTEGNTTMGDTDTTPAGAAATEVNTNEDARRGFTALRASAAKAAAALEALEEAQETLAAAQREMATAATSVSEGTAAKRFDSGATSAANAAVDGINAAMANTVTKGQIATMSEQVDTVAAAAEAGGSALDKYIDSENLVASEQVDPSTLASTSS